MSRIFGCAVGQCLLETVPDEFIWVEFRSVSREPFSMQTWVSLKTVPDGGPLVNCAAVPEQNHLSAQVFEQMFKKAGDFLIADVFTGVESDIKSNSFSFGRNTDG
ncbi:MAG: hypothetical protein QME64_10105 [bacterium]|nr:hypothetical protein [bacterium]